MRCGAIWPFTHYPPMTRWPPSADLMALCPQQVRLGCVVEGWFHGRGFLWDLGSFELFRSAVKTGVSSTGFFIMFRFSGLTTLIKKIVHAKLWWEANVAIVSRTWGRLLLGAPRMPNLRTCSGLWVPEFSGISVPKGTDSRYSSKVSQSLRCSF